MSIIRPQFGPPGDATASCATTRILVLHQTPGLGERIAQMFQGSDEVTIDSRRGLLSARIHNLSEVDMVVFETHPTCPRDLAALYGLPLAERSKTQFLALTPTALPPEEMRLWFGAGVEDVLALSELIPQNQILPFVGTRKADPKPPTGLRAEDSPFRSRRAKTYARPLLRKRRAAAPAPEQKAAPAPVTRPKAPDAPMAHTPVAAAKAGPAPQTELRDVAAVVPPKALEAPVPVAAQPPVAVQAAPVIPDIQAPALPQAAAPSQVQQGPMPPAMPAPSGGAGRITTVMRARGGAGASTVAVALAAHLALPVKGRAPQRVALVDLDIQNGNVGIFCDAPDCKGFTDLIKAQALADDAFLDGAMAAHKGGFDILTAPDEFAPLTALSPDMVAALLDCLQRRYDQILIDLPQAVLDWMEPVLARTSRGLIVTDTSVPAIKGARRLIDLITEDHMTLPVEVVVNREKRPFSLSPVHREAMEVLKRPLAHWIPDDPRAARKAVDTGQPLPQVARRSKMSKALERLAATLPRPDAPAERRVQD